MEEVSLLLLGRKKSSLLGQVWWSRGELWSRIVLRSYNTSESDMTVAYNRPDILVEKATQKWTIIDIAVPWCSQNRGMESWEVSEPSIWFELKSRHVETAILQLWIELKEQCQSDSSVQVSFFRHGWRSQHQNYSTVRNSRNTTQGDESLIYKSLSWKL